MPKKVIMVDDDVGVLPVVTDMLEDLGWDAQAVQSPTHAFVKLATDPSIEILIADINMPGLTGYGLAEKVSQIRPDVKILLLSGRQEEDGRYPLLRKPFMRADLAQVMERITGLCWSG